MEVLSKVWLQQRHRLKSCFKITLVREVQRLVGMSGLLNGDWRVVTQKTRPVGRSADHACLGLDTGNVARV